MNKRPPASKHTAADAYLAEVVAVRYMRDFVVDVTFSDGTARAIDLEPYLHGPIFAPLRADRERFRAVTVRAGTIGWDNDADIDPDTLYYQGDPPWATDPVTPTKHIPEKRRNPTLHLKSKG